MALPALAVRGRSLVDADTGTPVRLRGVNRSGLEYADPGPTGTGPLAFLRSVRLDETDIQRIAAWGATIVRIPFTQEFVLRGRRGASADDYLTALDQVIDWAEAAGLYTLLDLQWIDPDTYHGRHASGTVNHVPPLPNAESLDCWRLLAGRYRDRPAVLFDLFNEPHTPRDDDESPLTGVLPDGTLWPLPARKVGMDEWQPWALRLIAEIRAVHPTAVVFVSGVDWAYDLRGFPLRDRSGRPIEHVVYSTHVYPDSGGWWPWPLEWKWEGAFGDLAQAHPVFAGEWGGKDGDLDWGRRLRPYLDARGAGWTAWSWYDGPPLLVDPRNGDYTPTAFGSLVKSALGLP
jgi:endoglucanase